MTGVQQVNNDTTSEDGLLQPRPGWQRWRMMTNENDHDGDDENDNTEDEQRAATIAKTKGYKDEENNQPWTANDGVVDEEDSPRRDNDDDEMTTTMATIMIADDDDYAIQQE